MRAIVTTLIDRTAAGDELDDNAVLGLLMLSLRLAEGQPIRYVRSYMLRGPAALWVDLEPVTLPEG